MRAWKFGLCLMLLQCGLPLAAVAAGEAPNSAAMLRRLDASPQEDYDAALVAYNRGELIEAQGIFERAANRGHAGAMIELAGILERSGFNSDAAVWYRKAAELGDADGQFRLGSMYLDWDAYDKSKPGVTLDFASARKWFLLAAEQGHRAAIGIVASAYVGGGLGLGEQERSDAEVLKWIRRAIDVDNAEAMDAMAGAYRTGKYGMEVDLQEADAWEARAAELRGIKEEQSSTSKKKSKKSRL